MPNVSSSPTPTRLIDDLNDLHSSYVFAINSAIESGNEHRVKELAAGYDREATRMVAERENKTYMLPLGHKGEETAKPWGRLFTSGWRTRA